MGERPIILYLRSTEAARSGIVEHARHFRRSFDLLPVERVVDFLPEEASEEIDSRARRDVIEQWVREKALEFAEAGERVIVHAEIGNAMHREFWAAVFLQDALPKARFFATIHDPPTLTSNPYRYVRTEFEGRTPVRLLNVVLTKVAETLVGKARRFIERWFVGHCEGLFALSRAGCKALRESPMTRRVPVHETRLAIPTIESLPRSGGDADDVTITFFGFILADRGIEELIEAFERLCEALEAEDVPHRARLLIFGGLSRGARGVEAYVEGLRRRVGASPVAERIDFRPGFVDEAERERRLAATDVIVLPYKHVAGVRFSSGSAAWALARGKAVVASRSNTLAEVVRDGETGVLYEEGSCEALVDALRRLVRDDGLRERLGRAAREWIATEHSGERIARDLARAYGLETC